MNITAAELDGFVAEVDRSGGPGTVLAAPNWADFRYVPTIQVDTTIDPDGRAYFDQMLSLYEEIAGRKLNQAETEFTPLDPSALVQLESPYAFASPTERTVHYLRLARAFHRADVPKGGRVLDLGCGWGLSSEFMAQLGFVVDAVDINHLFVDLVRRRAARLGLPIRVTQSSFDEFEAEPESFDAVLFYECFHHAVRPADLLARIHSWLKPNAKLVLAGEPIQQLFWPHWGLRLDALSVYCIRKFGWFENGWSDLYLQRIVARSGLVPMLHIDPDPVIGTYLIGSNERVLGVSRLSQIVRAEEWWVEPEYLVSGRCGASGTVSLFAPRDAKSLCFEIFNFKPKAQQLTIALGDRDIRAVLKPGRNEVRFAVLNEALSGVSRFELKCATWCPDEVIHNGDRRELGFHLRQVTFE